MNIVFYVSTAVICNKTILNVIFFLQILFNNFAIFIYNECIETGLQLNNVWHHFSGTYEDKIIEIDTCF